MKLDHELCWADPISRYLVPIVSLENRSEHFASLWRKISPAHIVCIHLRCKKSNGKLNNSLNYYIVDFGLSFPYRYNIISNFLNYVFYRLEKVGKFQNRIPYEDGPKWQFPSSWFSVTCWFHVRDILRLQKKIIWGCPGGGVRGA